MRILSKVPGQYKRFDGPRSGLAKNARAFAQRAGGRADIIYQQEGTSSDACRHVRRQRRQSESRADILAPVGSGRVRPESVLRACGPVEEDMGIPDVQGQRVRQELRLVESAGFFAAFGAEEQGRDRGHPGVPDTGDQA